MTKIEWTDETWNPVTGCTKVSTGCKHCYAERMWPRLRTGRPFTDVQCHLERLKKPLRWRKPRRVFVNSMSDLFHHDVSHEFIATVFGVMATCPRHTFQVLTKRPQQMLEWFEWVANKKIRGLPGWPLSNVWLGVSIEDQATAESRIPLLLQTPAATRFVSVEPLLAPVDLPCGLDWVVAGGESGPRARPVQLSWVRALRDQCVEAGTPFFFKQWGEWAPYTGEAEQHHGSMQRVGRKAAGRELDGRVWDELPR